MCKSSKRKTESHDVIARRCAMKLGVAPSDNMYVWSLAQTPEVIKLLQLHNLSVRYDLAGLST